MMTNTVDFPGLLEAFKLALHSEDASRNTTSAYLSDLDHFVSWYAQTTGVFRIGEITPTDIRAYREFLQGQAPPSAPATINRRLAALRRFFSWAKEEHLIESQPAERIRNVEITSNGPRSLDRRQWHRLQRSIEQAKGMQGIRDRCIILMLYHTGLRAGELAPFERYHPWRAFWSDDGTTRQRKQNPARSPQCRGSCCHSRLLAGSPGK
jgi:integrase/recombinase XerD